MPRGADILKKDDGWRKRLENEMRDKVSNPAFPEFDEAQYHREVARLDSEEALVRLTNEKKTAKRMRKEEEIKRKEDQTPRDPRPCVECKKVFDDSKMVLCDSELGGDSGPYCDRVYCMGCAGLEQIPEEEVRQTRCLTRLQTYLSHRLGSFNPSKKPVVLRSMCFCL